MSYHGQIHEDVIKIIIIIKIYDGIKNKNKILSWIFIPGIDWPLNVLITRANFSRDSPRDTFRWLEEVVTSNNI